MSGPYGKNKDTAKWAADRGLRYRPHAHCLHWISKGRCGVGYCMHGAHSQGRSWMDHVSGWIDEDGNRLLLCQPYEKNVDCLKSVIAACEEFDLVGHISGKGWYGHGTFTIELQSRKQYEEQRKKWEKKREEQLRQEEMARMADAKKKVADAAMGSSK